LKILENAIAFGWKKWPQKIIKNSSKNHQINHQLMVPNSLRFLKQITKIIKQSLMNLENKSSKFHHPFFEFFCFLPNFPEISKKTQKFTTIPNQRQQNRRKPSVSERRRKCKRLNSAPVEMS